MTVKVTRKGSTALAFDRPLVVVVEGSDDAAFTAAQIELLGGTSAWQVHDMTGADTDWAAALRVIRSERWFREHGRGIGLVIDADVDPAAARQRCEGARVR